MAKIPNTLVVILVVLVVLASVAGTYFILSPTGDAPAGDQSVQNSGGVSLLVQKTPQHYPASGTVELMVSG